MFKSFTVGLVWAVAATGLLVGCSPAYTSSPEAVPSPPMAPPPTAEVLEKAHANYLLSKEINRTIVASGSSQLKQVAITFDDGPHPGKTEELLAVLTRLNVHATFFVVGKMALKAPNLLQDEVMQGSEVENHTYNHTHVTSLDDASIAREIFSTNDILEKYTGEPAVLFRPPGGRISWGAYRALRACGVVTVLWTDDPEDYLNPGKPDPVFQKLMLKRLMDHLRPGGIILLHDGIDDTIAIMPEFIKEVRARGYTIGTVTQLLLAEQHYELTHPAGSPAVAPPGGIRPVGIAPPLRIGPPVRGKPQLRGTPLRGTPLLRGTPVRRPVSVNPMAGFFPLRRPLQAAPNKFGAPGA